MTKLLVMFKGRLMILIGKDDNEAFTMLEKLASEHDSDLYSIKYRIGNSDNFVVLALTEEEITELYMRLRLRFANEALGEKL